MFNHICVAFCLGVGAYFDVSTRRIPNLWILFWFFIGFFLNGIPFIQTFFISIACLMLLFFMRVFGAGDIKLMALVAAYLGYRDAFVVLFTGMIFAAGYGLYYLIHKRILWSRFLYFKEYVLRSVGTGRILPYYEKEREYSIPLLPMAQFFLLAFLLWRLYELCMKAGI